MQQNPLEFEEQPMKNNIKSWQQRGQTSLIKEKRKRKKEEGKQETIQNKNPDKTRAICKRPFKKQWISQPKCKSFQDNATTS